MMRDPEPPLILASATWPEAAHVAPGRVLLVPVGSTEQHGPHLPFDTDTRIAEAIAQHVSARAPERCAVAPTVAYGASGEHVGFVGTLSIGHDALATMLIEIGRSSDAFAGVVFVNGHGGNATALARAETVLQYEGRKVMAWSWSIPGADAHAGRTETSLMLAIAPTSVHAETWEPGRTEPLADLEGDLRAHGVRAVSPNGVLGDPAGASAIEGTVLLGRLVDDLANRLTTWKA